MTAVRLTSLVKGDLSGSSVLPEASSPATTVDTLEEGYEIAGPSDSYAMRMSAGASIVSDVSLDPYSTLHPAMSRGEQFRDAVLRVLDKPVFQTLGILVLFLVILDGAIFFFFLMGWQTLCDTPSSTNCEPRNQIYNASVQILNGLFTYMAVVSLPWRCTQLVHAFGVTCPNRTNKLGHDIYGVWSHDVWYHIPLWHRQGILVCLLLNCLTQYANQATRLIYRTYELQSTSPGTIWVNVFFGLSMILAGIAGLWMGLISECIRKQNPERFGPGPIQILQAKLLEHHQDWSQRWCCQCICQSCCCGSTLQIAQLEVEAQERHRHDHPHHHHHPPPSMAHDPTRDSLTRSVLGGGSRTELRMFGM